MTQIRVIGPGCARCRRAFSEAEKAVVLAGVTANVSRSEDVDELLAYRIISTPALIVDGVLRCAGRVPRATEIASWLRPAGREEGAAASSAQVVLSGTTPARAPAASASVPSETRRRGRSAITWIMIASAVGLVLSVVLAVLHFRANTGAAASFCAVDAKIDCDAVALSPYSVVVGAPIAAWGVLAYASFGLLAISGVHASRPHPRWPSGLLALGAGAGVAASVGLAWLSEVRIGAFCVVCAACWATNAAIAGFAWRAMSVGGGALRCLRDDLGALRRRPVMTIGYLVGLAGVAAAVGVLYPPYWMPPGW